MGGNDLIQQQLVEQYRAVANKSVVKYLIATLLLFVGALISNRVYEAVMLPHEDNAFAGLIILVPLMSLTLGIPVFVSWVLTRVTKSPAWVFAGTLGSVLGHGFHMCLLLVFAAQMVIEVEFVKHQSDEFTYLATYLLVGIYQLVWVITGLKRAWRIRSGLSLQTV